MRLALQPIVEAANYLLSAIDRKSWHDTAVLAHGCLCDMPNPAWAEESPGMAIYYPGEREANAALNMLRVAVMLWMRELVNPDRSWEATDEWPEPTKLREAIERLEQFVPQPV